MSSFELAWAAGLFEGEGTVRINVPTRRNCGALLVSVVNTDREVIDFFQRRWPGYMKTAHRPSLRHRPAWVWVVAAHRAAAFLGAIRPDRDRRDRDRGARPRRRAREDENTSSRMRAEGGS
jgi:hypothetical protein